MAPSKTIGISSFKVVYGSYPLGPLDLVPRALDQKLSADVEEWVKEIQKLHEQVKHKNEKYNCTYENQGNKHWKNVVF